MTIAVDVTNVLIFAAKVWAFFFALGIGCLCILAYNQRHLPPPIQEELEEIEDAWIGIDIARANHPLPASVSMERRAA